MSGFALNSVGGFRAVNGPSDIGPDESFSLVEPPVFVAPIDLPAVVAAERYKREGTGITVDSFKIDTTRDGQALIAGAAVSAILDPDYRCNWKTGTGFIERNAVQLLAIATAVRAHVQACFDRERDLLLAVEAGEYRAEMLTEGWPDSPPSPAPAPEPEAQ